MDKRTRKQLDSVNWDFSDYNSSKYPLDLNSLHWYLATFPPLIPMYLISLLSDEGDVVFDPFGGAGTTAIKAIELNRKFIYNDLNPFAVGILEAKIDTLLHSHLSQTSFFNNEASLIDNYLIKKNETDNFIKNNNIDPDVTLWYEGDTLTELLSIMNLIKKEDSNNEKVQSIRKCAFSSILKAVCSQTDHITYITDNCRPKKLIYRDARSLYLKQINVMRMAAEEFFRRYTTIFTTAEAIIKNIEESLIGSGDSRSMPWIEDNSVDLVITSPPYLCAQDYIKTMRLTNMFYKNAETSSLVDLEIGARRKRARKAEPTVAEYYNDMEAVVAEISRVLRPGKYFCLVIGQGSGKVTQGVDTIEGVTEIVTKKFGFELSYQTCRSIWSRRIHVGGVSEEQILVFQKSLVESEQ